VDRLRGAARSSSHRRHDSPSEAWTVELCLPGGGAQCLAVDPEAHGSRTDSKTHDCEKSLKPSVDGFKKLRHPV